MSMDVERLAKRLEMHVYGNPRLRHNDGKDDMRKAATALRTLHSENARLAAEVERRTPEPALVERLREVVELDWPMLDHPRKDGIEYPVLDLLRALLEHMGDEKCGE